jgi:hypothetical protein
MTVLRAIKHSLTLVVGATMLAASLVLLTLLGLVAVAIPAALAILAMELPRARRWLRDPKLIWQTRRTPRAGARASARFNARIGNYQSFDS